MLPKYCDHIKPAYIASASGVPASWEATTHMMRRALAMGRADGATITTGHTGEADLPNVTRIIYRDGFTVDYEPITEGETDV